MNKLTETEIRLLEEIDLDIAESRKGKRRNPRKLRRVNTILIDRAAELAALKRLHG